MKKISSITVKLVSIGIIIGGLCIANTLIGGKMNEREKTYQNTQNEISQSAGGNFVVKGTDIVIPYEEKYESYENDKIVLKKRQGVKVIAADKILYDADLKSENRNLGIYHAPVYTGQLTVNSIFDISNLQNTEKLTYLFSEAMIIIPVHSSSLMDKPVFEINNQVKNTFFYSKNSDFYNNSNGIACSLDLSKAEKINLTTVLYIRGALKFMVMTGSSETKLNVVSDWPSPGFTNYEYLPDTREITDSGFTASWNIPFGSNNDSESIGFSFVEPANLYQKLHRAQNYAFLFIIVPFIVLFLFEIFFELNLHPVNYLLSGAASVIFFLLLLSMSEHIQFGLAYLLGAIASGLLVSFYVMSITKKVKLGGIMCAMFVLLYSYLFFCLQSEDYALLMGSVFAFVLLAIIMFITRKVNWANLKKSNNTVLIEE